ncbi:MAG: helix-turn-helix domain-containing protein [Acidobacteriaceae bacterium]
MQDKQAHDETSEIFTGVNENGNLEPSGTLWTVEDVAGYLKLQPETIRAMARRGELPAIKLGKVWRFQKTAIDEMLRYMTEESDELRLVRR